MTKKGFVALFVVILVGFISTMFVTASAVRVWIQGKGVQEARIKTITRFDAISCVNIARLKIFLNENISPGEYDTNGRNCIIETVYVGWNVMSIETKSGQNGIETSFESLVDAETLEVVSLKEI